MNNIVFNTKVFNTKVKYKSIQYKSIQYKSKIQYEITNKIASLMIEIESFD